MSEVAAKPAAKPIDNRVAPPSVLRRYGSQMGIIGVGLAMWLAFIIAAPTVFLDVDIYKAFAQTTPLFGVLALALTFVVITIGTSFLYRGVELVLMNGTGVALTPDKFPVMHLLLNSSPLGIPVQSLWTVLFAVVLWVLLNRTRFGAHVFLAGDNATSARLMGVNVASVKTRAFMLVGVMAVFAGLMTSFVGYYFWPTTGDGFLLNTIASVFLGGTSVFGGSGSIVGSLVASYIIGAINAGIVSAGINAFFTQLCFGLVIVLSVVLQTIIERRVRRQSIAGR